MNQIAMLCLAVLTFVQQGTLFNRFAYCREFSSGIFETQCIELKPDGVGQSRLKPRGGVEVSRNLTLSAPGREKFLSILAATRNLEDRQKYESKRRVANLGRKHITLELASETREAEFNYSDLKEVTALTTFFDGLINQQTFIVDLEAAARYDRLSIPERLDLLDNEIKVGRIGDPQGLIPALEKLIQDSNILDYARQHAQQMKSQILISK